MIIEVNDANFEKEVIEASKSKPVLVDFYATWCGVCKMMAPIFEEVAKETGDKVIFAKANAEETANATEKFEILSLPTFALFKDGKVEKSISGPQAKEMILDLLK
ncbi:MAG: thioredoxin [Patescibacteria group bacterium]|nr:thioredoxin [Patescibacteria group bacterium]